MFGGVYGKLQKNTQLNSLLPPFSWRMKDRLLQEKEDKLTEAHETERRLQQVREEMGLQKMGILPEKINC